MLLVPKSRSLAKYRMVVSSSLSTNRNGKSSLADVFSLQPRLTGGSQAKSSSRSLRCEAQMSSPPQPAGRLLPKNNQCPFGERLGLNSSAAAVLTGGPRFFGVSQGSLT